MYVCNWRWNWIISCLLWPQLQYYIFAKVHWRIHPNFTHCYKYKIRSSYDFYLHASLRMAYVINTVSAGLQSYGQINFDLLNHMSSFVLVYPTILYYFFYHGLLNSIVSFYSDTAETANENFVDTSEIRTLTFVQ